MKHKIVIIGSGNAGTALQTGLARAGYEVRFAKKGHITAIASRAEVIVERGERPRGGNANMAVVQRRA